MKKLLTSMFILVASLFLFSACSSDLLGCRYTGCFTAQEVAMHLPDDPTSIDQCNASIIRIRALWGDDEDLQFSFPPVTSSQVFTRHLPTDILYLAAYIAKIKATLSICESVGVDEAGQLWDFELPSIDGFQESVDQYEEYTKDNEITDEDINTAIETAEKNQMTEDEIKKVFEEAKGEE